MDNAKNPKSRIILIDSLMASDTISAMYELKQLVKSQLPKESASFFSDEEILHYKKAIIAAFMIQNNIFGPDVIKKSWIDSPDKHVPKDVDTHDTTHEHSVLKTYVEKYPDDTFIGTLIMRMLADNFVKKNETE
jgi:hypothetical protein